ncbi:ParB N-terminal domain-containing protein [Stetteria hydrogenophila]
MGAGLPNPLGPLGGRARLGLAPLARLRVHEQVIESHVLELVREILESGVVIRPILVDSKTMVILDGHHRVEALRRLGRRLAPAVLVDYDDECVTVSSWRPGWRVTKELVRMAGLTGRLLPPRTSRHRVCFDIPHVNYPLEKL